MAREYVQRKEADRSSKDREKRQLLGEQVRQNRSPGLTRILPKRLQNDSRSSVSGATHLLSSTIRTYIQCVSEAATWLQSNQRYCFKKRSATVVLLMHMGYFRPCRPGSDPHYFFFYFIQVCHEWPQKITHTNFQIFFISGSNDRNCRGMTAVINSFKTWTINSLMKKKNFN